MSLNNWDKWKDINYSGSKEDHHQEDLILQLEEKCDSVNTIAQRYFYRIEPLTNRGFPSMLVINDKLMPIEDYVRKLTEVGTNAASVWNITGATTPRVVLNALRNTFIILDEIRHIFLVKYHFYEV